MCTWPLTINSSLYIYIFYPAIKIRSKRTMAKEGRHNIWCYYGQLWWRWDKWASRKFPVLTITKPWRQHRALQRRQLAISNATLRDTENTKKEICSVFNQNGLRITIEANKQIINFLDVTFNLNNSTYQPFTKSNTTLQYVHRKSNHPPPITTKNIPAGINRRLSSLSLDKASFNQATSPY